MHALADAIDYVRGLQGYPRWRFSEDGGSQAPPPKILQASSCLKHFFACEPKPAQSPHLCLALSCSDLLRAMSDRTWQMMAPKTGEAKG